MATKPKDRPRLTAPTSEPPDGPSCVEAAVERITTSKGPAKKRIYQNSVSMISTRSLFTGLTVATVAFQTLVADAAVPTGEWPRSTGTVTSAKAIVVAAGTVFDGKMQTYERSDITCKGQTESNADTAMFLVEPGATLKDVIIGKNQMEGVHCDKHDCTIENVWWSDVCEDALSIKGGTATSVSRVIGGGARYADDKVVQHNGAGTVSIDGFYAQDFGKLYRSCGTCGAIQRTVFVSNVLVENPAVSVVTVNSNFGDVATLTNVHVRTKKDKVEICGKTTGRTGGEPIKVGSGPDGTTCKYTESDVVINDGAIHSTESSSPSAESVVAAAPAAPTPTPLTASTLASPNTGTLTLSPAAMAAAPAGSPTASLVIASTPVAATIPTLAPIIASTPAAATRQQLPGRVQAPQSFSGLAPLTQPSTVNSSPAAVNTQSLSFNRPLAPAPSARTSFGFRGFEGRRLRA